MRVLILSFFYHPEPNDIKIHTLGRELAARGHEVVAITTFPNYPYGEIYEGYKQRLWQWEDKDGVRLLRIPLYPDHSRSSIKRALSYLSFLLSASTLAPILSGPADVMWVYHPPLTTALAGAWTSLLRRVPFVLEIQDIWPETLTSTGMIDDSFALQLIGWIARRIYFRAAHITVNSPGFEKNLIEKGIPADKVTVVPNWADETIYQPVERDPALGDEYGLGGKFNVIFGGNMGLAQDLQTVIEAVTQLQDQPEIQFVLIGDGLERPNLQAEVEQRGLSNIRFIEQQPAANMPGFYAWADALLVHLKDDPLFSITIPAKTTAYMACGRPVIAALAGDGADVVQQAQAGIVSPPGDASALAKAVLRLYTMPRIERETLGENARQAYLAQYGQTVAIDRYEALFRSIIASQNN